MLKLCKSTLNNNIISYNENKRDLNKLGSELNVLVGEEVRTPFGRGTVKKWRDSDGMVEIKLIWNALLVTKPLGLPNVTNNISGESDGRLLLLFFPKRWNKGEEQNGIRMTSTQS